MMRLHFTLIIMALMPFSGNAFADPCDAVIEELKSSHKAELSADSKQVPSFELINKVKEGLSSCQPMLSIADDDKAEFVACFGYGGGGAPVDESNLISEEEDAQKLLNCKFPSSLSDYNKLYLIFASLLKRRANDQRRVETAQEAEDDRKRQVEVEQSKKAEVAERSRINSPQYNAKKVCACGIARTFTNSKIAEENRLGKIGGFVDKVKLHQYSNQYVMIEKAEKYYKSKAKGKSAACNDVKRNWDAVTGCLDGTPNEVFQ